MLSGCFVLSQSGRGGKRGEGLRVFGSEVLSTRNNIMTHFNVVARSVGCQSGEMRSSADTRGKWGSFLVCLKFKALQVWKSNIHFISHFFVLFYFSPPRH